MRVARYRGRAVMMIEETSGLDVAAASGGRWGPGLDQLFDDWTAFRTWADNLGEPPLDRVAINPAYLQAPVERPRQIFAAGLNFAEHVEETSSEAPAQFPPVFTKFASALAGADTVVRLPLGGHTDWEIELVVVIGVCAREIVAADGWRHVAGLAVGQDLSERVSQFDGALPQFSLGKSFEGFSPIGPWLVTPDELTNPDDVALECRLDGEVVQSARTASMTVSVPDLIAGLSQVVTLLPGDVIFTGTPSGVGLGRDPQRFIEPGQTLTSTIDGIGTITQRFV